MGDEWKRVAGGAKSGRGRGAKAFGQFKKVHKNGLSLEERLHSRIILKKN
jgi:hypothetical protein